MIFTLSDSDQDALFPGRSGSGVTGSRPFLDSIKTQSMILMISGGGFPRRRTVAMSAALIVWKNIISLYIRVHHMNRIGSREGLFLEEFFFIRNKITTYLFLLKSCLSKYNNRMKVFLGRLNQPRA